MVVVKLQCPCTILNNADLQKKILTLVEMIVAQERT